jgi:hypothetical protein
MTILKEIVGDRPLFTLDEFKATYELFREACEQAGVEPKVIMSAAAQTLCAEVPGFRDRMELRASQIDSFPGLH